MRAQRARLGLSARGKFLVADGFGVGFARVGGAQQEFGHRIDHDRLAVAADDVGAFVEFVAFGGEDRGRVGAHPETVVADVGRLPLVVEARELDGLHDGHVVIQDVGDDLEDGVDDRGAAGAAGDEHECAVFQDEGRGHGRERAFAGGDGVGGTLEEAKHVFDADLRGEVVHFVVHEDAGAGDGDAGAEAAVERVGVADGVAGGVDDRVVGSLGGFGGVETRALGGEGLPTGGFTGSEAVARCGFGGVEIFHETGEISAVEKPRGGNVHEIRVAEEFSAVAEGAAHDFDEEVVFRGGVGAELGDVKGLEHAEHLQQGDAARAGRGHGDDLVAAVVAAQGRALDGGITFEVGEGDVAAVFGHGVGDEAGGFAFVKFARAVFLEAGEGGGELGLAPEDAGLVKRAVGEVDALGLRKLTEKFGGGFEAGGGRLGNNKTIGGEAAGGFADVGPSDFTGAVFLLGEREAGDGAGDATGAPTDGGGAGAGFDDVAVGADIHVAAGLGGRGLAVVDGDVAPIGEVDHHETATTDVAGKRKYHGEREADGGAGIDGVAAFFEDFHAGFGGEDVGGGDDRVLSFNGGALRVGEGRGGENQRGAGEPRGQATGNHHGAPRFCVTSGGASGSLEALYEVNAERVIIRCRLVL